MIAAPCPGSRHDNFADKYGFFSEHVVECCGRILKCTHPEVAHSMADQAVLEPTGGSRAGNRALSVMDQIREAVLNGSVAAGERLNEVRLSRALAVSRTPVRAALPALAGEGLLDYAPNRGVTVREFPLDA